MDFARFASAAGPSARRRDAVDAGLSARRGYAADGSAPPQSVRKGFCTSLLDSESTMHLGRIIGSLVASTKVPGLDGIKFLLVQPLNRDQVPVGEPVVAADAVAMAGEGELVYFVASREASLALPEKFVPVDHAIVGIVDQVSYLQDDEA